MRTVYSGLVDENSSGRPSPFMAGFIAVVTTVV